MPDLSYLTDLQRVLVFYSLFTIGSIIILVGIWLSIKNTKPNGS